MEFRPLGSSDLAISPLGLGTWAIAGPNWEFGWGPQNDAESIAALERAAELGLNWIDTAAVYGLGHAETVVGQMLRRVDAGKRPMVFTKGSLVWDQKTRKISHSLEPASLAREVEASLSRLGVETIDLYQIHWPAFAPGDPDDGIEAAIDTLAKLQRAGKIRAIGVSNFDVVQLQRALAVAPIASLQPPYSALMRDVEAEILPFCEQAGVGVIPYSTLQSGLLSGSMTRERIANLPDDDWRKTRGADFREPRLTQNLALVDGMRTIGERHGVSPAVVAIAWVLRQPAVAGAIVGARRPEQLDALIPAATFRLSDAEIDELRPLLPKGSGANVPDRA
ncbi:aldo/keto reductase [Aureimonas ureilytica]|uniref:Aldo/keto reductase n=1 Tax=Aureimonas ureilytica TaxID=401562 RepID=A0A175RIK3_9HYPH|nr:aldo/keto reductase [Aureimonas ureilytica]KTR03600.1 aldo/keto reductase [Aureimonas ureilytica]